MKSELKERIKKAEDEFERYKSYLDSSTEEIQATLENFGYFREASLKEVIGKYKKFLDRLNKKYKNAQYDIPYEIKSIYNLPSFEFKSTSVIDNCKEQLTMKSLKFVERSLNSANAAICKYASKNIPNFKPTVASNNSSQSGWFDLLVCGLELLSAKLAKDETERTEVERYCNKINISVAKIQNQITFNKKIQSRIYELHQVSLDLYLCVNESLTEFKEIINLFDINNDSHVDSFRKMTMLAKAFSEISKIEILNDNNELSAFDTTYIINTRKLLSETF